jgi:hypothetical protein
MTYLNRAPRNGTVPGPADWTDRAQKIADVLGFVPGLNVPAEIASGLISLRKRDYVGVALSVAGLVPFEGSWAVALKTARAARQTTRIAHAAAHWIGA